MTLKKYARVNRVRLLHSSDEWYSACEFKLGVFNHSYISCNIHNSLLIDKSIGVISISTYLDTYYKKRGIATTKIPVIMDCLESLEIKKKNDIINISYVGSPGRKDNIKNILDAISELPSKYKARFAFHFVGISEADIAPIVGKYEKKKAANIPNIKAYGRIKHDDAICVLRESDYSILVRPMKERYSKAGFPTKVVEAMKNGVAMICNLTSDLDLYLHDMKNSIILYDDSSRAILNGLMRVATLSTQEIVNMRYEAKITAVNSFDYRIYKETLQKIIGGQS